MNVNYELLQDRHPVIYAAEGRDHIAHAHFHKKLELLYNFSEEKRVTVGTNDYIMRPHNVLLVDSYQLHAYESSEGEQCILTLPVVNCEHYFSYRKGKVLCTNLVTDTQYCAERLLPYFTAVMRYESLDHFTLQANVDMLLSGICAKTGLETSNNYTLEGVDSILAYIEQNYDKDLTLTSLADHFGYSKYYFSRMFNEMFHTSLNDYLSVIRLQHTFSYFEEHDCSITTAALNSGFGSMPTFYRVLKKNHTEYSLKSLKKEK